MSIMPDLYLASKSPRRRELLQKMAVQFDVVDVNVPEVHQTGEAATDYVCRLAMAKAQAGGTVVGDRVPVLGSDTVVVLNGNVLEKPLDQSHFVEMMTSLSGVEHQVMTAVALVLGDTSQVQVETTKVCFRQLSATDIAEYWQTGEPQDKAGGYGIQGIGGTFVEKVEGSYSGVVGLPLQRTQQLLQAFAVPFQALTESELRKHFQAQS